jgi:hypothetical protein
MNRVMYIGQETSVFLGENYWRKLNSTSIQEQLLAYKH